MTSLSDAIEIVVAQTSPLPLTRVPLSESIGLVIAENLIARESLPLFDSSAVDGYALDTAAIAGASTENPISLPVAGTIKAGAASAGVLPPECAVRIMTGAPIPRGATAVIMQEQVERSDSAIRVSRTIRSGENIRIHGEEIAAGTTALTSPSVATARVVGLAATLGYESLLVLPTPRVAVVTTGDELRPVGDPLSPGTIRDSNATFLAAALSETGVRDVRLTERVSDNKRRLASALGDALRDADLLIVTGGVSVGDYDYVRPVLKELGVVEHFWGVNMKPGKPVLFGSKEGKLVFGLPGNPVSVAVLFYELVYPAIRKMGGHGELTLRQGTAILRDSLSKKTPRCELVRGDLVENNGVFSVTPIPFRGSHMMSGFAKANCLILFPENEHHLAAQRMVTVHLLPGSA